MYPTSSRYKKWCPSGCGKKLMAITRVSFAKSRFVNVYQCPICQKYYVASAEDKKEYVEMDWYKHQNEQHTTDIGTATYNC